MDVLRRVKALRRRPEKIVEDSLSSDCGALHLHHPGWYGHAHKVVRHLPTPPQGGGGGANLISYEDLHSLSSADLGLSLSVFRPQTPSLCSSADSEVTQSGGGRGLKGKKWPRPQIKVTGVGGAKGLKVELNSKKSKARNDVYRSNSFKFERYERDDLSSMNSFGSAGFGDPNNYKQQVGPR